MTRRTSASAIMTPSRVMSAKRKTLREQYEEVLILRLLVLNAMQLRLLRGKP